MATAKRIISAAIITTAGLAAVGMSAGTAAADPGPAATVGNENIGSAAAAASAFDDAHDNLNFNHIADRWNVEVLNNSPIASDNQDVQYGIGGTVHDTLNGDIANVTDSVNETGKQILANVEGGK
ncbi:hypothetical protein AB0M28_28220 [Streptomyces sp. NPDC051940]|uniref:hypothetical protein n=1 Tax=Streptomyces sp. NPDC051940 TaxID=3155675 RepID=UPI00344893AF